jgi:hypothetical protein
VRESATPIAPGDVDGWIVNPSRRSSRVAVRPEAMPTNAPNATSLAQ